MSAPIGSQANPLRVAVIGAGPSGLYAAEELLKQTDIHTVVDLFDHLPTPYGLVRGGVAPDHQKIKSVVKLYEKTATREGCRFFGNVTYGQEIGLDDLLERYHQVLFSTGAQLDRRMGIPGEELPGSYPATEFVAWYNGHPDYTGASFDLSCQAVAVIGNGNVAMDVVRMLTAPVEELAKTDMADYALEALRQSQVKTVYLIGRRGPAQAAFTTPEIKELANLQGVDLLFDPADMALDPLSQKFLEDPANRTQQKNMEVMAEAHQKGGSGQPRQIKVLFLRSPVALEGNGRVESIVLEKNRLEADSRGNPAARGTGQKETLPVGAVFRSIGYRGQSLPAVPFNESWGTIPHQEGRVLDQPDGRPVGRLYTSGWIKRGPSGVIGTNKSCAAETVKTMLSDLATLPPLAASSDISQLLAQKGAQPVSFQDWKKLDEEEVRLGEAAGRPRIKFTNVAQMLSFLGR